MTKAGFLAEYLNKLIFFAIVFRALWRFTL